MKMSKYLGNVGVHATHCCVLHGCKYSDDDCPVVNQIVKQEYACEDCSDDIRFDVITEIQIEKKMFEQLIQNKMKFYIFNKNKLSLMEGQIIDFQYTSEHLMCVITKIHEKLEGLQDGFCIACFQ